MLLPLLLLAVTIGLIANIHFIASPFIGGFAFFLFVAVTGYTAGESVIAHTVGISQKFIRCAIGAFLVFNALAFFSGIFIVLYQFTPIILDCIIVAVSLISFIFYRARSTGKFQHNVIRDISAFFTGFKKAAFRAARFNYNSYRAPLYIALSFLFLIGFWTLYSRSQPNGFIKTPWEVIPGEFAWVLAAISAILFGMIFFRPRPALLAGIILFSFLQHAYIPAVYRMPYGLDDWRHIGMMERIENDGVIPPYIIVPHTDWAHLGPFKIPQALVSGSKTSYAAFWAAALFLHKVLHINLVKLTVWWQYAMFSLFAPILLYALFRALRSLMSQGTAPPESPKNAITKLEHQPVAWAAIERLPLAAALLSAAFYPMQLYGAISLPVGFHFLFFLFFLLTVVSWMNRPSKARAALLACEFGLMFFGYIIYWLIAFLILGFLIVDGATRGYEMSIPKKALRLLYLFASAWFIPIVSLRASPNARFDILTTGMEYFGDFWKHAVQYILGFKPTGSPRPQAGNLIWHDMQSIGAHTAFFNFQYADTILLALFIVLLGLGLYAATHPSLSRERSRVFSFALYFFAICLASIFLDRYYFGGIHLLTERMDLIFDLSFIIIAVFGMQWLLERFPLYCTRFLSLRAKRSNLFCGLNMRLLRRSAPHNDSFRTVWLGEVLTKAALAVFLGLVIGSTIASGPRYGRATSAHFQAMQKVYRDMQLRRGTVPLLTKEGLGEVKNYCLLTEEFTVAAMEAASRGRVVNGNFPIQYGYLEDRGKLFIKMFSKPDIRWMREAMEASGKGGCYIALDKRFLTDWNLQQIRWILGREIFRVDGVYVWRYDGDMSLLVP